MDVIKNGNKQAFPCTDGDRVWEDGLSKREYMATQILSGIMVKRDPQSREDSEKHVEMAIRYTDILLSKLEKTNQK